MKHRCGTHSATGRPGWRSLRAHAPPAQSMRQAPASLLQCAVSPPPCVEPASRNYSSLPQSSRSQGHRQPHPTRCRYGQIRTLTAHPVFRFISQLCSIITPMARGSLQSFHVGGPVRFDPQEVAKWLRSEYGVVPADGKKHLYPHNLYEGKNGISRDSPTQPSLNEKLALCRLRVSCLRSSYLTSNSKRTDVASPRFVWSHQPSVVSTRQLP